MNAQRLKLLFAILVFNSLTAITGGVMLLANFNAPPPDWLAHTPFNSYVIPALVLLVAVGGSALSAWLAMWMRRPAGQPLAFLSGLIMCGWIICELLLLRQFSWLQVLYLLTGVAVLDLSYAGTRVFLAKRST